MQIIIGLIVAVLTWLLIFLIMELTCYALQELNHEIRSAKQSFKQAKWDLEWAWKLAKRKVR